MHDGDLGDQNRVLTSWKEIAAYLGKGVRTVQRWEKDFGLPVRRPTGSDKSAILARARDLDAWVAMRCSTRMLPDGAISHNHRLLSTRSALAAALATSLMLRETNAALLSEVREAVVDLRNEIARLRRRGQPHAPAIPQAIPCPQSIAPPREEAPVVGAA
ncbi:MAG TPA: hypothetical protein VHU89_04005 [Acidobacteriaceae bacterium]|nr:hypothetical protein [Acidobacteriaceae bacterium]